MTWVLVPRGGGGGGGGGRKHIFLSQAPLPFFPHPSRVSQPRFLGMDAAARGDTNPVPPFLPGYTAPPPPPFPISTVETVSNLWPPDTPFSARKEEELGNGGKFRLSSCFFGVDVIWIFQSLFFFVFSREMGASLHAKQKGGASVSFVAKNQRLRN